MPRVSVILPTWNGADLLAAALHSLERQSVRDFEVIVVDNGSTDGTQELLARDFPSVRTVRFEQNRGFAAAVNAGIQAARGEIVALLNNDAEAAPGWLGALVAVLEANPDVGSCASKVLDYEDRSRIDSAGDQLGIFASQIGHGEPDGPRFDRPREVLSACAAAAAYRRRCFDEVGLFDERFFAYFEDVDWGIRARLAGDRCLYVPEAVAFHRGGATSGRISDRTFYLRMRNSLFLFFQYMPARRILVWSPLVLAWPFVRTALESRSPRLALGAVLDFARDLPAVLARRRATKRLRRISWKEYRRALAPPLARSGPLRPPRSRPAPRPLEARGEHGVVDAIVVNRNGRRYLPECLRALKASSYPVRIWLVDNASGDDSVAYARREHPDVEVMALTHNAGYAGGANAGLRRAAGEYALVMNPDVILEPDYVAHLKARLDADRSIGAAQGKLYAIGEREFGADLARRGGRLDSAGHVIRRSRFVLDRGQGREDGPPFSFEASVFSASGAALLLRRTMLEDLAPDGEFFDESFFAYKEDIDLCWRARWLGWDIRYVPDAVGYHVRAWAGTGLPPKARIPLAVRRHSWKNHYLLLWKNDRSPDLLRAWPYVLGWEAVRHAYALVRDPAVYGAYLELWRLWPQARRRRREILARRRVTPREMRRWFGADPRPIESSGTTARTVAGAAGR